MIKANFQLTLTKLLGDIINNSHSPTTEKTNHKIHMKRFILPLLILSTNFCLSQSGKGKVEKQSFDKYIELDSSNIVLVPVEWDNDAKVGGTKIIGNGRTKNILFYNAQNDSYKFLFEDSLEINNSNKHLFEGNLHMNDSNKYLLEDSLQIIVSYTGQLSYMMYPYERAIDTVKPITDEHLYYTVIKEDYNGDEKLDYHDPKYLYCSKYDGSDLTLLTPEFYYLKYYKYIKSTNIILATLIQDDNGDKNFNNKDSEVLYKIDLNDLSKSKFIVKLKLKEKNE